ncbi:MAG: leucine-rich repeat protein [Oscillospiraceae bacterium]|nr:leucine-rich repeat protein [Oscillospiraceae bacterium]
MKKRILSIFLAMAISISFITVEILSVSAADSGIDWSLDDDGLLIIESDAGMTDWTRNGRGVNRLAVRSVIIQDSVTSVVDSAFWYCTGLTSVTIGNGVINIGNDAFSGCIGLAEIIIPYGVTSIGAQAFEACIGLTGITIPDSVTSIGVRAFFGCIGLTSVSISNRVTNIANFVFSGCTGLTEIIIPNSVRTIGSWAFENCTKLTEIIIPDSVTSIGVGAFENCAELRSVTFGNGVTSIGDYAFSGCTELTQIKVSADNQIYSDIDGVLFNKNVSFLWQYPPGRQGGYTIPDSVTSIGALAFSYCEGLTSVTIPDGVTSIGSVAFGNCTGLTSVLFKSQTPPTFRPDVFRNVPSNMTVYVSIGAKAAYQAELNEFNIVEGEPIIGDCNHDGRINIADLTYLKRVVVGYMPEIFVNRPECWLTDESKRTQKPEAADITRLKDFLTGKISSL